MAHLLLDIETVPGTVLSDDELLESIAAPGNYKDPAKIAAYKADKMDDARRKQALSGGLGECVSIAWTWDDGPVTCEWRKQGESESDLLQAVTQSWRQTVDHDLGPVNFVVFNGEFDLKFIWQRLKVLQIPVPTWWPRPLDIKPWSNNIIDVMHQWGGKDKVSQRNLCRYLSIPYDDTIDGSGVWDAWKGQRYDEIAQHNIADVVRLHQIWRRLE